MKILPKKVKDPLYKYSTYAAVARKFGDSDLLELAEANRLRALNAKALAMPPAQRVKHLQQRLKEERETRRQRIKAQEATGSEIHQLQQRLQEAVKAVGDQRDVEEAARTELEDAELQLPR